MGFGVGYLLFVEDLNYCKKYSSQAGFSCFIRTKMISSRELFLCRSCFFDVVFLGNHFNLLGQEKRSDCCNFYNIQI